uniref:ATP-dependent DNA helicase n=1 Tax=Aegilops tauschii subsp. strangulata TaxID=200361 RepID=A0A453QHI5_AEGTS
MHMVSYHVKEKIKNIIDRDGTKKSMLTTYFEANNLHVKARGILYRDFPEYYTRQRRIISAHPAEGERYYLRVLLNHVTGATSYEGLRTIDGQVMPTFREAAEKRGLIEADNTLDDAMTEAELFQVSSSLRRLFTTILSMGKDIESFPLPKIDKQNGTTNDVPKEIIEETSIEVDPEDASLHKNLNNEQRKAYDKILATVDCQRGGLFFVDGPGGTGNTFLYRALLATIRGQGKIAVATATSGVAASIMPGTRAQIVDASLRRSELWNCMHQLKLVRNMRAPNDPWFTEYLLRVGNGTEETNDDGEILLPTSICVPNKADDNGLDRLIDSIYQPASLKDPKYITSRAILSTRNDCVDKINLKMIDRFQGEEMVYHSFDSVEDDPHNYYPPKFLNTLTPNGLPPHMLKLKINCPIILLRNIDPANGLCNGTRLLVRGFQKNAIDAEIVVGQHSGMRVFLPRIPLCPSDDDMFPFSFKRKQFSIRLSFAMTINKSQGQTIANVGIYLPEPVFSHGQLYVALSRATTTANIKVLTGTHDENKEKNKKISTSDTYTKEEKKKKNKNKNISASKTYTKNIVYTEVLTK